MNSDGLVMGFLSMEHFFQLMSFFHMGVLVSWFRGLEISWKRLVISVAVRRPLY